MEGKSRRELLWDFSSTAINSPVDESNLYKPRDDDIIVVGPPKSGTTWMQQILHQIRTKGDELFDDIYKVTKVITNPKRHIIDPDLNSEQICNPRIFKHHESYGVIPKTPLQKQLFIIRDPFDTGYSWVKFIDAFYGSQYDISDQDVSDMIRSCYETNISSYFNTVCTWWPHRKDANVLFFFYEDMKKDLTSTIRKVFDFIQIPLTREEFERVNYLCSFEYMFQHKQKFQGTNLTEVLANSAGLQPWLPKLGMVREGKIGEGLKNIGPKFKETLEQLWNETIGEKYGFNTYEEMYFNETSSKV